MRKTAAAVALVTIISMSGCGILPGHDDPAPDVQSGQAKGSGADGTQAPDGRDERTGDASGTQAGSPGYAATLPVDGTETTESALASEPPAETNAAYAGGGTYRAGVGLDPGRYVTVPGKSGMHIDVYPYGDTQEPPLHADSLPGSPVTFDLHDDDAVSVHGDGTIKRVGDAAPAR